MHRPAPSVARIERPRSDSMPLAEPAVARIERPRSDGMPLADPRAARIEYPSSDGKPMAENDFQLDAMVYGIAALKHHFRNREDVYVSGDLLIYYEEGNRRASVAPDMFVVFGVGKHVRKTYLLWEEGPAPAFVLEVASPSTWRRDVKEKRKLYERLGVQEYWHFDPEGTLLPSRLQGSRLTGSRYERQPVEADADGTLTMRSAALGLELRAAPAQDMRFRDPATRLDLRSLDEAEAACRAEAAGRRAEAAGRRAAEARVAELEALLRLRQRRD